MLQTRSIIKVVSWCGMPVFKENQSGILFTALFPCRQCDNRRIFLHRRRGKSVSVVNFRGSPEALRPEQFRLGDILEFRLRHTMTPGNFTLRDLVLRQYFQRADVLFEKIFSGEGINIWSEVVQQCDFFDSLIYPVNQSEVVVRERVREIMQLLFSDYMAIWLERLPEIWRCCCEGLLWRATKAPLVL